MQDDNEVLDWDEDDDQLQPEAVDRRNGQAGADADDDDDAVSLGGDDDERDYFTQESPDKAVSSFSDTALNNVGSRHEPNLQEYTAPQSQRRAGTAGHPSKRRSPPPSPGKRSQPPLPQSIPGLPAKPVVPTVPYFRPSHPSLTEATAMSRPAAREPVKSTKPISTSSSNALTPPPDSVEAPLPPGWELRHSRTNPDDVFYFNIINGETTWNRPTEITSLRYPGTDKTSNSLQDRRYRTGEPGASATSPTGKQGKRAGTTDTWFPGGSGPDYSAQQSPYSRERERSVSPPPRGERGRIPTRTIRSSRQAGRGANSDRDDSSERHWVAPTGSGSRRQPRQRRDLDRERSPPFVGSRDQYPRDSQASRGPRNSSRDSRPPPRGDRDREQQSDRNISTHRHNRSPPRSAHNPSFDSISPVPQARGPPPIPTSDSNGASKGRERASRFDRPAAPPPILTALEDDDSHVPDEFLESVKPATPQETSNYQASSSAVEQAHDAPPAAQRRKPLPPQAATFRMNHHGRGPSGPNPNVDPPPPQRSPQSSLAKDTRGPGTAISSVPSGPRNSRQSGRGAESRQVSSPFIVSAPSTLDSTNPSNSPSSRRYTSEGTRPQTEKENGADGDVPKGPRAMAGPAPSMYPTRPPRDPSPRGSARDLRRLESMPRPPRGGRGSRGGPPPGPRLSGTNSIPINNSRYKPTGPVDSSDAPERDERDERKEKAESRGRSSRLDDDLSPRQPMDSAGNLDSNIRRPETPRTPESRHDPRDEQRFGQHPPTRSGHLPRDDRRPDHHLDERDDVQPERRRPEREEFRHERRPEQWDEPRSDRRSDQSRIERRPEQRDEHRTEQRSEQRDGSRFEPRPDQRSESRSEKRDELTSESRADKPKRASDPNASVRSSDNPRSDPPPRRLKRDRWGTTDSANGTKQPAPVSQPALRYDPMRGLQPDDPNTVANRYGVDDMDIDQPIGEVPNVLSLEDRMGLSHETLNPRPHGLPMKPQPFVTDSSSPRPSRSEARNRSPSPNLSSDGPRGHGRRQGFGRDDSMAEVHLANLDIRRDDGDTPPRPSYSRNSSLLDRLADRVVPAKRDRDAMGNGHDRDYHIDDGPDIARKRRRGGKPRRGTGGGARGR